MNPNEFLHTPETRRRSFERHLTPDVAYKKPAEEVGVFDGALEAPFTGLKHGLDVERAKYMTAVSEMDLFETVGDGGLEQYIDRVASSSRQSMRESRVDAKTMGMVAQGVHGFASIIPPMIVGAAGGVPGVALSIGTAIGFDKYDELRKDVDHDTAMQGALVSGTVMGVSSALAPYYGGKLVTQLATGLGMNVGAGVGERAGIKDVLENAGYDKIAKQYEVWDKTAMGVDAILGAGLVFGGRYLRGRRIPQQATDDALTADLGLNQMTGGSELATSKSGLEANLARAELADEQLLSGVTPRDMVLPALHQDNIPNPKIADEIAIAARGMDAAASETGKSLESIIESHRISDELISKETDAFQIRSTEEMDVRQRAEDGEAVAKRNAAEEVTAARAKAEEEVKVGASEAAARASDDVAKLQEDARQEAATMTGDDFEMAEARNIVERKPDMPTIDADGNQMTAREVLARAEEDFRNSEKDASLHNIAIQCLLSNRGGL